MIDHIEIGMKDYEGMTESGEIVIYNPDATIRLEVRMAQESVWLSQQQMGMLFGVDRTVIVKHIGNIYKSGELTEVATCAKIAQVRNEGGRAVQRGQKLYNLDMILSVGYRVNSLHATYFRMWATTLNKNATSISPDKYIGKGYGSAVRLVRTVN